MEFCWFKQHLKGLRTTVKQKIETFALYFCLRFLFKRSIRVLCNLSSTRKMSPLCTQFRNGSKGSKDVEVLNREVFVSEHSVWSVLWQRHVRNYVADSATCSNQILTPGRYLTLHEKRAQFVVVKYWARSNSNNLSPSRVGGCTALCG